MSENPVPWQPDADAAQATARYLFVTTTPCNLPARIIVVPEIPRMESGKIVEIAEPETQ